MRVTVEQHLPCDLGTLHRFLDRATRLVESDMTAHVTYDAERLSICSAKEYEE